MKKNIEQLMLDVLKRIEGAVIISHLQQQAVHNVKVKRMSVGVEDERKFAAEYQKEMAKLLKKYKLS